ncbi:YeiH family protein [Halothermothrix orenii]|uniref:Conserved hypothetical integral membrane protein TIGR00698 n=1 Tax=Halothermothrix orenii (strain H 168 / OCM 544 / DSM 9562) TaxID=373903 RepID=B8D276_HALOH|nr:putative sulfate exporter family transporter [Halothermothrix orenii]ACL69303.1 conserved hypothetical integral membrane protein TIGR00698 [Halothermothrix orenii H 168]
MKAFKEKIPGILLAVFVGITGRLVGNFVPNIGGVTIAIILGFLAGNIFRLDSNYAKGIKFVEKKILSLAIMLMGLKLQMDVLAELGISSIVIIIIMVTLTVFVGSLIGRLCGLSNSFSILLGIGNGICGSSAIAAAAPIVSNNEEEIGLSVSVVNLLGTFGIFILPVITGLLKLNETTSGLMIGSTLQATGQVVAAGFSISDLTGEVATIVKMARILMLGPVVLLLSFLFGKKDNSLDNNVSIPPFIIGFFIFSIIGTLQILPVGVVQSLKYTGKLLLTVAMAGIGLRIRISSLINQGPKALLVGLLIFVVQLVSITGLIYFFLLK